MSFQSSHTELKNFLPISKLGEGTFSTVYKVKRIHDGQIYALKKIKMQKLNQKEKQNALNQIRILASIKSDFIISYKQAFYDQSLNLLCIVMEFAEEGDLQKSISDHLKAKTRFKEQQIWKAASQILIGLLILHQKDILHRDLKSANVFISSKNYKLGDLNVSKICNQEMAKTQTGTPYYASPQVWRDEPYNAKCDIWSFGCLLYEMCCLQPPFKGADLDQLFKAVQKGQYRSIPSQYSIQLSKLIRFCLNVDPKKRLSTRELIRQFPYFNKKFNENQQYHQIQSLSSLLKTIQLPTNLNDLVKNLPLPDYQNLIKQCPKTAYKQAQEKETMMMRDKINFQKQKLQPLPQKMKECQKQQRLPFRKRPSRPQTASKVSDKLMIRNELRPLSAVHGPSYKLHHSEKIQKKLRIPTQNNEKLELIKAKYNFKKEKSISLETQKIINNRIKSCSPKNRSQKNEIIYPRPSIRDKEANLMQKILSKDVYEQKTNDINSSLKQILPLNQKVYLQCKQNSLKRVSSLQKKVNYLRQQRKERKVILEKNKQNSFSVQSNIFRNQNLDIKERLKQKIKQNSQVFSLKRHQKNIAQIQPDFIRNQKSNYLNEGRVNYLQNIQKNLESRKKNLSYGRYVVSAESKRIRSQHSINENRNERSVERKIGMIRRIPSNLLPSIGIQRKLIKRDFESEDYKKQMNNMQRKPLNDYSMIENSQAIIRLKKRIKNRMICQDNQQKQIQSKVPLNKYYY